jgi:hypothetical protein
MTWQEGRNPAAPTIGGSSRSPRNKGATLRLPRQRAAVSAGLLFRTTPGEAAFCESNVACTAWPNTPPRLVKRFSPPGSRRAGMRWSSRMRAHWTSTVSPMSYLMRAPHRSSVEALPFKRPRHGHPHDDTTADGKRRAQPRRPPCHVTCAFDRRRCRGRYRPRTGGEGGTPSHRARTGHSCSASGRGPWAWVPGRTADPACIR